MKEKTIIVTTQTNTHQVKDGVLSVKSDRLVPVRGNDGRMILRYYFDCKITVPQNVIGLVLPPNVASGMSLSQVGSYILFPGVNEEPFIEYKINTDAIPAVFEQQDFCASIIFLPIITEHPGFSIETVIKPVDQPVKEEAQPEAKEEQADVNPAPFETEGTSVDETETLNSPVGVVAEES